MYDKRPDTDQAIDRAWAIVGQAQRGEMVEHEALEAALGVARPDHRYYELMDRIKRKAEDEQGISLVAVPSLGYVLATPKEQLELARFRSVQAARRLRKGARHAGALPESECSFTELRAKQAIEERLAQAERTMRGEAQRIAFLMRPREQRPRLARPDEGEATAV